MHDNIYAVFHIIIVKGVSAVADKLLIGVITTDCFVDFQRDIMNGIISQAFRSSCDVAVIAPLSNFYNTTRYSEAEAAVLDFILSDRFDGFIYNRNSFLSDEIKNMIDSLCIRSGKPVMLLDYEYHKKFDTISADDCTAFEKIVDHLIDVHGCRKIYCITGPKGQECSEERLSGYFCSMKKHKLYYDKNYYFYGDFWKNYAAEIAEKILHGELDMPDAIACGNDIMASALTDRLITGGIRVPEDIAVTGYDASMDGYRTNPSITSFRRPNYQLGAEALRRLYRIITGRICNRITAEEGGLRIGRSCGCNENTRLVHSIQRRNKIDEEVSYVLSTGDSLIELTSAETLGELMNVIDNYTYMIYKMNRFTIFLTQAFENALRNEKSSVLNFGLNSPVRAVLDKSAIHRYPCSQSFITSDEVLDKLRSDKKQPMAFYLSTLSYQNDVFGFCALSFGKSPITFSSIYLQWIKHIEVALRGVMLRYQAKTKLRRFENAAVRDSLTGLLNKNGFISACESRLSEKSEEETVSYIHIELSELKSRYYRSGRAEAEEIIRSFSEILRSALNPGEICGTVTPACFGILSDCRERGEELFYFIRQRLESSVINRGSSFGTMFSIGVYSGEKSEFGDIYELMHKAAVSSKLSYSHEDTGVNPQFEKICRLRSSLMKNPEKEWKVSEIADELYISKSYLQKNYKHYFNRSIIEELIYFRIEKAKKLLAGTDMTITDISRECGYSTYNYFVRRFRSSENMSPSEYRDLNKY